MISVVIPTIGAQGPLGLQQAWQAYQKSGQHYGVFTTPEAAQRYAELIQQWRQRMYQPATAAPTPQVQPPI